MSTKELESKIKELRQLQALIDEATTEIESIKDCIKATMGDTETLTAGEYKVSWKAVTTSRLDTAALKQAMPELVAQYTRPTTSRRFVIA